MQPLLCSHLRPLRSGLHREGRPCVTGSSKSDPATSGMVQVILPQLYIKPLGKIIQGHWEQLNNGLKLVFECRPGEWESKLNKLSVPGAPCNFATSKCSWARWPVVGAKTAQRQCSWDQCGKRRFVGPGNRWVSSLGTLEPPETAGASKSWGSGWPWRVFSGGCKHGTMKIFMSSVLEPQVR